MRRHWFLLVPLVLALVVGGCKINSINSFPSRPAQVRVINLLPGVASVDVTVGSNKLWTGVAFQTSTDYQSLDNVVQQFTVTVTGTTNQLLQSSYVLAGEQPYTLTISGTPSQPVLNLLQEVAQPPSNGSVLISAFNAASNAAAIDLYVVTPGTNISNIAPNFFGLNYNGTTFNFSFSPGTYQIIATTSPTKTVIYDSGPVTVTGNTGLFFVPYSAGSNLLVNAAMLQSKGPAILQNSKLAQVKMLHAAPQTGGVDLLQNTVPIITNRTYSGFGGYVTVPAGPTQVMSFVNTGTTTPTLASVSASLLPGTDQTVFLTGVPSALQAVYLADLNVVAPPSGVLVRFINASPNAGPVNISGATPALVTGLASPTASSYVNMAQGGVTFTFTDTTTGATLVTLPDVTLTSTQTYSIYLLGPVGALTAVVTRDF